MLYNAHNRYYHSWGSDKQDEVKAVTAVEVLVEVLEDVREPVRVLLLGDGLVVVLGGLVLHLQDGPAAGVGVLPLGDGVRGLPGPRRRLRIAV